jgi:hypothetical protein
MSTQNPTITLVYQKNLPKEQVKAHWLVSANGLALRQFFLKPQEHKRRARKQAFLEASTWIHLTYSGSELAKIGLGIFSNQPVQDTEAGQTDWNALSQELEEVEVNR